MGWLFYTDRRIKSYADEKAEISRLCTFDSDTRKTELVKSCKVGSTWYAAAKVTNLDGTPVEDATYVTDADGSITFGVVFGPVPFSCRPKCSFRPLSVRMRPGFSNPMLSAVGADCRSH